MSAKRGARLAPRTRSVPLAAFGPVTFGAAVVVTTKFIVAGLLPAMARDLGIAAGEAGRLVIWFALASAVLGPVLTAATGRWEPRRVLVASLIVFAVGNLLTAMCASIVVITAVRAMQSAVLPAFISVGSAAVAHRAGPQRAGQAITYVNFGVVAGVVVVAPAGVALTDGLGWAVSFVCLSALAAAAAVSVGVTFPNLPGFGTPAVRSQLAILRRPALSAHLLLSAVLFAAMFATYTHLAVWLEHVAGFGGGAVGVALLSFGAAGFAGNWAAGRLADRHPTVATAVVAAVLAVMNAALPLAGSVSSLLPPVLATWGAAHAAAFVLCQIRVMAVGDGAPAFASSLNISACNAGIAFGAAAGGWIIERHGIAMMGFGGTALAGGALLLAFLLARSAVRRSAGGGHPFHQCR